MKNKDIKLLWGRAASRCSFCKVELAQDCNAAALSFTLGEQAHIVSESANGPRGASPLAKDDRNSYHNIILLCPTHHTEIDSNVPDWPVELLHQKKSEHELWVSETLSDIGSEKALAKDLAVGTIIDSAVELCRLEQWREWSSFLLGPEPTVEVAFPNDVFEFRQRVAAALWPPEFGELERATRTLAFTLSTSFSRLEEHGEITNGYWRPVRFYKIASHNPNYDADLERYEAWIDSIYSAIYEATKAANWFSDTVRRDYNPLFFAETGRFGIVEGPMEDLQWHARVLKYSDADKGSLPASLLTDGKFSF